MVRDVMLIHCNEREEVVEIETYTESSGAIISLKKTEAAQPQPFANFHQGVVEQGWQIDRREVNHIGHNRPDTSSYVAYRNHPKTEPAS